MRAQVTTAVILAFFSPSCFSGYYVNSELSEYSESKIVYLDLFSFQYSYLYNLTRVCIGNMNFVNLNLYRIVYFNILTSIFNRQR